MTSLLLWPVLKREQEDGDRKGKVTLLLSIRCPGKLKPLFCFLCSKNGTVLQVYFLRAISLLIEQLTEWLIILESIFYSFQRDTRKSTARFWLYSRRRWLWDSARQPPILRCLRFLKCIFLRKWSWKLQKVVIWPQFLFQAIQYGYRKTRTLMLISNSL